MLDTTIPGQDAGALDAERLGRLDATLAQEPEALTVIAAGFGVHAVLDGALSSHVQPVART